jgi:hypothetical protein
MQPSPSPPIQQSHPVSRDKVANSDDIEAHRPGGAAANGNGFIQLLIGEYVVLENERFLNHRQRTRPANAVTASDFHH